MKSIAIVTMSDSNFFELVTDLIDSINFFNERENVAICVLDAGLKESEIKILSQKVDVIKKANWDIKVPDHKIRGKEWLKSQVSRAFLPKYFPGYKKYLWIDADAWVNSWEAIKLYIQGSENNKLAIATSADRSYGRVLRVDWIFGGFAKVKSQNYKHAKTSGFSEEVARKVALKPHLNIGVFCLNHDAPHWIIWQKNLEKALKGGKVWGSEQIAMNITIYNDQQEVEILPAYCNWTLVDNLKFDLKRNTFVEPYLPHHEIGIVHLAGKDNKTRFDKNFLAEIPTIEGKTVKKSLRYKKKLENKN